MRKVLLGLTLLSLAALGAPAYAVPVPAGCVAVSAGAVKTCTFIANINNGLEVDAIAYDNFAVTVNGRLCNDGGLGVEAIFVCGVNTGDRVVARVEVGVISVRNLP